MSTILVGVDGSDSAATALAWALAFARRTGDEIVGVYAYEPDQAELPPDVVDERRGEAEAALEEWLAPLRRDGVRYRAELVDDHPSGGLLRAADDTDASLIIVGRRGSGGFAGLHIGSVAEHLAHHTERPLVLVPDGTVATPPEHVVVGVSEPGSNEVAVQWSAAHRDALGDVAEVHVPGGRRTAAELIDAVNDRGAGLLVVGTSSTSERTGIRLGGVALQLVHHAPVALLLVPH